MTNDPLPNGWIQNGQLLTRIVTFIAFKDGLNFVNNVADIAELHNHHPNITINYCKVTLSLTTHDAGALTEKDYALAKAINALPLLA